jgi:hypothetical protein
MTANSPKKVAIINHNPSQNQGEEWITIPKELAMIWGSIPPHGDLRDVKSHVWPILNWLDAIKPDTIWVQGEMTAVAVIWGWARDHGCKAVVATTERCSVEVTEPDGSVKKTAVFKHCRFREVPL